MIFCGLLVPAYSAYITDGVSSAGADAVKMNWFSKENWEAVSGVDSIHVRKTGSSNLIYVTSEGNSNTMKIAYVPEEAMDLSGYNELVFEMAADEKSAVTYELTYYCGEKTFVESVRSENGKKSTAYFALPRENSGSVSRIELSVGNTDKSLKYFTVDNIFADTHRTYSYGERFSSRMIETPEGKAVYNDEYIELIPDENGVYADCTLIKDYGKETAMVVVEIYSPHSGIINLENRSAQTIQTTALYGGTAKYSFMVSEVSDSLKIGFYEGDTSSSSPIKFISLEIINITEDKTETYGTIESCSYENGKVIVKGTLDSHAAVEYISSKLALYKVPFDYDGERELFEPEAEMNISTVFEIEAPIDYEHVRWKYLIAIKTKDDVIPITDPVFAFSRSSLSTAGQECRVGIHNVQTTAAFESGADDIVLDIALDRLFTTVNIGSAIRYAHGDNVYYMSGDYVNELMSSIEFYTSIGSKVYIRLIGEGDDFMGFSAEDEASVDILCASAAYIGSTFKKAAGVIVFSDFDYGDDKEESAKKLSLLIGMFVSSFRDVNSTADIILSVDEDMSYVAPLTAYFNKKNGITNIGLMYECRNTADSVASVKAVNDAAAAMSASFRSLLILWKPEGSFPDASEFTSLYDTASKSAISGVVFSSNEKITTDTICECFAGIHGEGYVTHEFSATADGEYYRGSYSLWDFTDSYNTFGWLAGGSCSAPETARSSGGEGRVLKTVITPSGGEEGILVCWLEGVTDLSVADSLKMDFNIDANTGEAMPVTLVLGGSGLKAEYKSEVYYGENSIYADLGLFGESNRVEYVAVIVDMDKEATLEISKISVVSRQLGSEELKSEFVTVEENERDMASLYIFVGAVISSTVVIFAILSKKSATKRGVDK